MKTEIIKGTIGKHPPFDLFVDRFLRIVFFSRSANWLDVSEVYFGDEEPLRRLDKEWLTWLRRNHNRTIEDAEAFAGMIEQHAPELMGVKVELSPEYLPPHQTCSHLNLTYWLQSPAPL